LRVLTFNSHQPYIYLLAAAMPWEIGVIAPKLSSGKSLNWDERIRPLLPNLSLFTSLGSATSAIRWDWILAHNVNDLLDCRDLRLPKVFLIHGTLSGRILQDRSSMDRRAYLEKLRVILDSSDCEIVYISDLKREDWGLPGRVIRSAIDMSQYGGYRGDLRGVLQVCNHIRERAPMLGWQVHLEVCAGLPALVLGANPGLRGGRMSSSWEDLKEQYRSYRVYLHTAVYPYEDGYNLAMLEAMASGMPIATIQSPTSPIQDGVDGVVGRNGSELRDRVMWLLDNPAEATKLGAAARVALERQFPMAAFQSAWSALASSLS
jgi:glycosyltransferase involved in cell wall biosynthesis